MMFCDKIASPPTDFSAPQTLFSPTIPSSSWNELMGVSVLPIVALNILANLHNLVMSQPQNTILKFAAISVISVSILFLGCGLSALEGTARAIYALICLPLLPLYFAGRLICRCFSIHTSSNFFTVTSLSMRLITTAGVNFGILPVITAAISMRCITERKNITVLG